MRYSSYYYELLYLYAPLIRHNEKKRRREQKNVQEYISSSRLGKEKR